MYGTKYSQVVGMLTLFGHLWNNLFLSSEEAGADRESDNPSHTASSECGPPPGTAVGQAGLPRHLQQVCKPL